MVFTGLLLLAVASLVLANKPGFAEADFSDHNFKLKITGVKGQLKDQIRSFIGSAEPANVDDLPRYLNSVQQNAVTSLQALGFYNVKTSIKHATYKDSTVVLLNITTGKPVRISKINLSINGSASSDPEFTSSLGKLPLREGHVFNHGNYERSKDIIFGNAHNLGYFDAAFVRTQVLVKRKENRAEIFLELDSKERYRISKVSYHGNLFKSEFLKRWQPFDENVPYRASYVRELTQRLQNSGYFKSVRIKPALDQAVDNKLPLIVDLEPASENIASIGVGYATDSGPRVKGNWLRPHTNSSGHKVEIDTSLSRLRQEISFGYRIPHRKRPITGSYTLDLGLSNHRTDDTFSQLRTMDIGDHRLTSRGWTRHLFLRWENEPFRIGDLKDTTTLLLPGIGISKKNAAGGFNPSKGIFFSFKLLAGSSKLLSDISMVRTTASVKALNSWGKHHFITAVDIGALTTRDFLRIPPSHRFFAGGDNSVRGFSYQSISPLDDANEATGGQYLTTASLEYNYYFRENWAIAAFVDTGRAFIDFDDRYRVGVGTGIRWVSPVGPLRIDIGYGITEDNRPLRLHLAIGPQL